MRASSGFATLVDERGLDGMLISRIANKRYFSGLRLT